MNKTKLGIAVIAALMVFTTSTVAFAQTPNPPTPPTPPAYGQTFWQTFAEKLGVTVEKLQGALREALKATVDQALKDGKLAQAQADKARTGIDELTFDRPLFGQFLAARRFKEIAARFVTGKEAMDAAAAKLGMTTRELSAALRDGKSLADLAKDKGVNPDDLKAAMVAAVNAKIDEAVKSGKLTQAQADQIKSRVEKGIDLDKRVPQNWLKNRRPFPPRFKPALRPGTP